MVDETTPSERAAHSIDVLFILSTALVPITATTPYREEHTLKRAMIERAHRVVARSNPVEVRQRAVFSFARFDEIDVL